VPRPKTRIRTKSNTLQTSVSALLETNQLDLALRTLEHAISGVREYQDWHEIQTVFRTVPEPIRLSSPSWATGFARTLRGTRDTQTLLDFTALALERYTGPVAAPIALERGWALMASAHHTEALETIQPLIPELTGQDLGFAHRCLGEVHFELGQPWQADFVAARQLLQGRALGLAMLNEGTCFDQNGDHHQARTIWLETFELLKGDPFHQAWLRYNLGASYLREGNLEAERNFLLTAELAKSKRAKDLRIWAMIGLGAIRRLQGEWQRAETQYRHAVKLARANDQREQAWWGLGHTLRLAGRPAEAFECLHRAASFAANGITWVKVSLAGALLDLDRDTEASQALEQVGLVTGNEVARLAIMRAELSRRNGDTAAALEHLRTLPANSLTVREELSLFPALRELTEDIRLPPALEVQARTLVQVQALGVLSVSVNARAVPIQPTSRVGELLVLLLECNAHAAIDALLDSLWPHMPPGKPERDRKRKSLWWLVKELRHLLGWPESVQALQGAYRLDPRAIWQYDAKEARSKGESSSMFLEGVYSSWAREVAEGLAALDV
jgi:tetratricopeptide (TPR) repeat protein